MSQTNILDQDLSLGARSTEELLVLSEANRTTFTEIVGQLDGLGETAPELVTALDAQPFAKYNSGSDASSHRNS